MKSLFLVGLLGSLALNVAALSPERSVSSVSFLTSTTCSVAPVVPVTLRAAQRAGVNPLLAAFDADRDGKLSAAEIDHASTLLRMLDSNRDGSLTADEFPLPCGSL